MKTIKAIIGSENELSKIGYDPSKLKLAWPFNYEKEGDIVYHLVNHIDDLRTENCICGSFTEIENYAKNKYREIPSCTFDQQLDQYRNKNLHSCLGVIFHRSKNSPFDRFYFYAQDGLL
jgi:hypothetical protein